MLVNTNQYRSAAGIVIWHARPDVPGNTWEADVDGFGAIRIQRNIDGIFFATVNDEPVLGADTPAVLMNEMDMYVLRTLETRTN